MDDEMRALSENETFQITPLPAGSKAVGGRWVFAIKSGPNEEKHKDRLVAKGYSQIQEIDYEKTFSPTARMTSIRTVIQLAVQNNLDVHQLDVKAAYLNAPIDKEIYVEQPDGYVVKALGLLQAGLPFGEVSANTNVNRKTIFRLRQSLHKKDTVSDRPRSGRPRCTTQRQDKNLVRNHINNRFLSVSASSRQTRGRNNQRIGANTVRRRLSTSGSQARRPYIGPILNQRHRHQRTLWAQEHAA
ncbi:reverse transcriptase [Elysia marginata]|uniref:Reverse transcriptase n=1 Tax=Elysia marginata TaxID=1093978 RepID=A0AAV4GAR6_9GAST|nr:reverse transcriptase [Elysia marginata]